MPSAAVFLREPRPPAHWLAPGRPNVKRFHFQRSLAALPCQPVRPPRRPAAAHRLPVWSHCSRPPAAGVARPPFAPPALPSTQQAGVEGGRPFTGHVSASTSNGVVRGGGAGRAGRRPRRGPVRLPTRSLPPSAVVPRSGPLSADGDRPGPHLGRLLRGAGAPRPVWLPENTPTFGKLMTGSSSTRPPFGPQTRRFLTPQPGVFPENAPRSPQEAFPWVRPSTYAEGVESAVSSLSRSRFSATPRPTAAKAEPGHRGRISSPQLNGCSHED
jgi:hypothetical protein